MQLKTNTIFHLNSTRKFSTAETLFIKLNLSVHRDRFVFGDRQDTDKIFTGSDWTEEIAIRLYTLNKIYP